MILPILLACTPIDGDTIRCGSERIRLVAIDAPEMPGHCRRNRHCAPGDPKQSWAALGMSLAAKQVTIDRTGVDRYGRTLGHVYRNGINVACIQINGGWAIYKPEYDKGRRLKRECGL